MGNTIGIVQILYTAIYQMQNQCWSYCILEHLRKQVGYEVPSSNYGV